MQFQKIIRFHMCSIILPNSLIFNTYLQKLSYCLHHLYFLKKFYFLLCNHYTLWSGDQGLRSPEAGSAQGLILQCSCSELLSSPCELELGFMEVSGAQSGWFKQTCIGGGARSLEEGQEGTSSPPNASALPGSRKYYFLRSVLFSNCIPLQIFQHFLSKIL